MSFRLPIIILFCIATIFYSCKKEVIITHSDTIVKQDSAYLKHVADSIYVKHLIDTLSGTYIVSGDYDKYYAGNYDTTFIIDSQQLVISPAPSNPTLMRISFFPLYITGFIDSTPYAPLGNVTSFRFNNQVGNQASYTQIKFVKADEDSIDVIRSISYGNGSQSYTWTVGGRKVH